MGGKWTPMRLAEGGWREDAHTQRSVRFRVCGEQRSDADGALKTGAEAEASFWEAPWLDGALLLLGEARKGVDQSADPKGRWGYLDGREQRRFRYDGPREGATDVGVRQRCDHHGAPAGATTMQGSARMDVLLAYLPARNRGADSRESLSVVGALEEEVADLVVVRCRSGYLLCSYLLLAYYLLLPQREGSTGRLGGRARTQQQQTNPLLPRTSSMSLSTHTHTRAHETAFDRAAVRASGSAPFAFRFTLTTADAREPLAHYLRYPSGASSVVPVELVSDVAGLDGKMAWGCTN
ncbi:hypothetical protein Q7P37_011437 [Cladosporium fusiforme]